MNSSTHCVRTSFTGAGTAELIDFGQFSLDNYPFNPQAAYFDNTQGTSDMIFQVIGLGFQLTIPAGAMVATNFPSPANVRVNITGTGPINIFWLDYPVTIQPPGGISQEVTVGNTPLPVNVTEGFVGIRGNTPQDKSITDTVDAVSTLLIAANPSRTSIEVQAPQTAGIWVNKCGGVAGPNLSGCIYIPAGAIYESGITVNQNEWNYYCDTAGLVIPVIEGN